MPVDNTTWAEFIDHCFAEQQLSEKTIENTLRRLRFLERHGIDLMADEETLRKQVMMHFAQRRKNEGVKGTALNDYVKALNRWCKFRGFGLRFKKYKEEYKPRKIPTTEEIKRFMNAIKNKMLRTAVYLLVMGGLRIEELTNMNLEDIDWERGAIIVKGKGNKMRIIPLPARVLYGRNVPSLYLYIKHHRLNTDEHALFTTSKGRLQPAYLRKLIKKVAREVGLPWIHPHSFRHYYATNLLRAGVNIRIVQHLLGHADIKTTGIYLHIVEQDLRAAVENPNIQDPIKYRGKKANSKIGRLLFKKYDKASYSPARNYANFKDIKSIATPYFSSLLFLRGGCHV